MSMTELQKEIQAAFNFIAAISVTGEDQDRAVVAKEHLRRAYKLAAPAPESAPVTGEEEGTDGE